MVAFGMVSVCCSCGLLRYSFCLCILRRALQILINQIISHMVKVNEFGTILDLLLHQMENQGGGGLPG